MADLQKAQAYNTGGDTSSVGAQLVEHKYHRKAIIELAKERVFGQLAKVTAMPKHYGKEIKTYRYIPLLDDRNINDQGIDATGKATTAYEYASNFVDTNNYSYAIVGYGATAAAAETDYDTKLLAWATANGMTQTTTATIVAALEAGGVKVITTSAAVSASGNLYGSSKDVGTLSKEMPVLGEHGGRVNRVGSTRIDIKSRLANYGFFQEYTRDMLDFDTDPELKMHITRESMRGANEIIEDLLQIDLINAAAVIMLGGDATETAELDKTSTLSYGLLVKTEQILNTNRCPKETKLIAGSRLTDTRTIAAARYIYAGSEIKHTLLSMKDFHDREAWIPVQKYSDASNTAAGEIGSIGGFRFIEVEEMMRWEGAGAGDSTNKPDATFYQTDDKYDVFPLLVVGSESFTTIGFNSKEGSKFEIIHKKAGPETADRTDPFGKTGFFSIQWWYGFMALRPEWIACIKVTAPESLT